MRVVRMKGRRLLIVATNEVKKKLVKKTTFILNSEILYRLIC